MQFPLYCEAVPLSGVFEDLDEDVSGEVQQLTDTVTHTTHAHTTRHYSIVYMDQGVVSLTYLSILEEGFTPIFSATLSYGKSVSP